jgi:hypothetical protein
MIVSRLTALLMAGSLSTAVALGATCTEPTFSRYRLYPASLGLQSLKTADLNGDGRDDVVTGGEDASVTIHLANAEGELVVASVLDVGAEVKSLGIGDVTGDTGLDIVVGTESYVVLLEGDGSGGFSEPLATAAEAASVSVGQFDLDAELEAVMSGATTATLVNFGAGDAVLTNLSVGGGLLAGGEFNGDNLRDFAIHDRSSLSIWLNDGTGSFSRSGDPYASSEIYDIGSVDLDVDGIDEVFVRVAAGYRGYDVSGTSITPIFDFIGAMSFVTEDMNLDGRPDLIMAFNNGVRIAYQSAAGTFQSPVATGALFTGGVFARADFDGDDERDWVIGGGAGFLTLPGRLFEPSVPYGLFVERGGAFTWQIHMSDLDHDGDFDAVIPVNMMVIPGASAYLSVMHYDSSRLQFVEAAAYELWGSSSTMAVGDLNGDGELDVVTEPALGSTAILFGDGEGGFSAPVAVPTPFGAPSILDVDNDGDNDLLFSAAGQFAIHRNSGAGSFDTPETQLTTDEALAIPMLADGDAFIDLVAVATTGATPYFNDGSGNFSADLSSEFPMPAVNHYSTGDLDGDGDVDLAVNGYGSAVALIENVGSGKFALRENIELAGMGTIEVRDLSDDGLADIVVSSSVGAGTAAGLIYINRGSWIFAPAQPVLSLGADVLHVTDLNADGRDDVVLMNLHGRALFSEQRCSSVEVDDVLGSTPSSGGEVIQVKGKGFKPGARVYFGGVPVPAVTQLDTKTIQTIAPAGLAAGTLADVTVVNVDDERGALSDELFVHFNDVNASSGIFPFVEKIFRAGITGGCAGGNFCPGAPITRAQSAVFIEAGKRGSLFLPPPATGLFGDVPTSHFAAAWIEQLARDGITGGCGGGNFCPSSAVTRGQAAVLLLAAKHGAGYQPTPASGVFDDVPADAPFAPWIEQLARDGITAGCGNNRFCPDQPASRGAMAVFISKLFLP